jgi:tetratricopeptide (TPR) repeat protein
VPLSRQTPVPVSTLRRAGALGIALAAVAVYQGTLEAPLVFDDRLWVSLNPTLRSLASALGPKPAGSLVGGRPVLSLSLAFNHAISGDGAWSYHAANLGIHIVAALILLGVVARTLAYRPAQFPTGTDRVFPALAAALLWAVHPLQTEAVTYVSQRSESLMGLLYLLTLYAFIRGAQTPEPRAWQVVAVAACALGMATKEVMVTAPLVVLAYDRTFVSGSFRGALRARRGLYLGLALTWLLPGLLASGLGARGVGYGLGYSWWAYALSECWAVGHYILLSVWPHPLVFDYGASLGAGAAEILAWACLLTVLAGLSAAAFARRSALGFAGVCFFLILAPSSSLVPVAHQPMAEHRMYLPLAAVTAALAAGAWARLGRRSLPLLVAAALALGIAAALRNRDYRSEVSLWEATVRDRPGNPRARQALADALERESRHGEAAREYTEALRIDPGDYRSRLGLGEALYGMGRADDALAQYRGIAPLTPDSAELHCDIGLALERTGRLQEAVAQFGEALRIDPGCAGALAGLGRLAPARRP